MRRLDLFGEPGSDSGLISLKPEVDQISSKCARKLRFENVPIKPEIVIF